MEAEKLEDKSEPPKGKRNMLLWGIGLIVIMAVIVAAAFMMNNGSNKDKLASENANNGIASGTIGVGDFIYYHTESGALAAAYVWMNVTSVDSASYQFNVNNNGFDYPQSITKTAVIDPMNLYDSTLSSIGKESISTPIGTRSVNHYQGAVSGGSVDYYVGDNKIVYKVEYSLSTMSITILLQSSSLSWV